MMLTRPDVVTEERSRARRWAVLATVAAGLLLITLDNSILYTALPTLSGDLGATGSQALWIVNAYPVVMAGLLLGSGTLGDRVGHRRMFMIGLVVFGASSLLAAFATSAMMLIAARAMLAVGAAVMMPATLALVRATFTDVRERNLAIAVWGSIAIVGAALGPIVGGALLSHFWWGSVFLVNVPVVLAALTAAAAVIPRVLPDRSKRWDGVSSVYAMVGLVGLVLCIKELAHRPPAWGTVALGAVAAVGGLRAFVRRQRASDDPLVDFAIFRNKAFSAGVLAAAFALFTIAGLQLVTTQRFQLVEGFSPMSAGLLVAAVAAGALPTALLGGAILHRTGLLVLITGGLGVASVGAGVTLLAIRADSTAAIAVGFLVVGAGLGAVMSVASTAIVGNVEVDKAGMAASVEELSYEFGSVTAVAVLGSLLAFVYSATVDLPAGTPDVAGETLTDAIAVAGGDPAVLGPASSAFDAAYSTTSAVVAVVLVVGTVVTARLLRSYGPGTDAATSAH